jgi:hypothetical protein
MLSFLITSGVIALVPNSKPNGVKLVALDTMVLCEQITFSNSSIHFPFFSSYKHFLIPENISLFALSIATLACGCHFQIVGAVIFANAFTSIVTTPSERIPYYRLNHSIWSLSDNKESSC